MKEGMLCLKKSSASAAASSVGFASDRERPLSGTRSLHFTELFSETHAQSST